MNLKVNTVTVTIKRVRCFSSFKLITTAGVRKYKWLFYDVVGEKLQYVNKVYNEYPKIIITEQTHFGGNTIAMGRMVQRGLITHQQHGDYLPMNESMGSLDTFVILNCYPYKCKF